MNSPITGKEMSIINSESHIIFRGTKVPYLHSAYMCDETGLTFTTTELDTENLARMNDKYKELKKSQKENKTALVIFVAVVLILLTAVIL